MGMLSRVRPPHTHHTPLTAIGSPPGASASRLRLRRGSGSSFKPRIALQAQDRPTAPCQAVFVIHETAVVAPTSDLVPFGVAKRACASINAPNRIPSASVSMVG